MITGDTKLGAFRAAEAFVLPSHQENFGIAVAESLACATPVLISNKVNIWREVVEDRAGLIAEDTLAGTTQMLETWISMTPQERNTLAQNAFACFARRFHIDAAAMSILETIVGYTGSAQPSAA
jgi:glycosyltransferase involved in cell wall biosynthesis